MTILVWDSRNVVGMEGKGVSRILTEVDERGWILREIGLDADARVVYLAPAERGRYPYGLFDLQIIDTTDGLSSDFPQAEFDALWAEAAPEFGGRANRTAPLRKPK